MLSELGRRPMVNQNEGSFGDDFEKEIGLLFREKRRQETDDLERELNLYRSGSAPPTVEGSLSAVGGLFGGGGGGGGGAVFSGFDRGKIGNGLSSDEDFRSDPAYLSYYYSNVNLNPRLPPPLLSKEELRYAQRLKGGNSVVGGIGDRRKVNRPDGNSNDDRSLFSMPLGFESRKKQNDVEWGGDGLIGLPGIGLGSKQIFQDEFGRATPMTGHLSRPASRNAFDENTDTENELAHLPCEPKSHTYAAALGVSLSRSTTPDPQVIARAPSPCPTPIGAGRVNVSEKRGMNIPGINGGINGSSDIVSGLSGMSLSVNNGRLDEENRNDPESCMLGFQGGCDQINQQHPLSKNSESGRFVKSGDTINSSYRGEFQKSGVYPGNSYMKGSPTSTLGHNVRYQHLDNQNSSFGNFRLGGSVGLGGYSVSPPLASVMASQLGTSNLPPLLENVAAASALGLQGVDPRVYGASVASGQTDLVGNQIPALQQQFLDPMYLQYLRNSEYAAQLAALNDPLMDRISMGNNNSYMNSLELQKPYIGQLLSSQKSHFGAPSGGKYGSSNHYGYYGAPYTGFPNSPVGPGSPMRHGEPNFPFNPRMRNLTGGFMGSWLDTGLDEGFGSSLLEEFKSNKAKCFELSEIVGHVVEFSGDQYGSRYIQQKLETATKEEKTMVYEEIMPHALALMTDVFGNYVIQKFLEHGLPSQRRELAVKLFTNVLSLSLQMYGCRVIQKAIEVVDLDQKIEMVKELDGNVMRCVRDQNGNHVIQKCIECIPEENIQFIVSTFYDQIVTLSTHPYGCRVVQRILEHCKDLKTQSKVMDEILSSVSLLAQDQYGNYVVQHVLEHGKPHERSIIIKELAGKIVQMSQQKFASNVVEKCVTFGDPSERQFLVSEMLGTTDENEPLQTMMKDQFGNYVVQKVLETCDDQMRELILSRIKVHLNALKKYTYGKHIVSRVEKLVAAGERRMAVQSLNPPPVA